MLLVVLVLLLIKKQTGLLRQNTQAVCFKKKDISFFHYGTETHDFSVWVGSQFDPTRLARYSPGDWIEISISESSPSSRSCSIGAPGVSNSAAS